LILNPPPQKIKLSKDLSDSSSTSLDQLFRLSNLSYTYLVLLLSLLILLWEAFQIFYLHVRSSWTLNRAVYRSILDSFIRICPIDCFLGLYLCWSIFVAAHYHLLPCLTFLRLLRLHSIIRCMAYQVNWFVGLWSIRYKIFYVSFQFMRSSTVIYSYRSSQLLIIHSMDLWCTQSSKRWSNLGSGAIYKENEWKMNEN
jgi:hypothetical protein